KHHKFNDKPAKDEGSNFGRLARGGFMKDYIEGVMAMLLSGIPAKHWHEFIRIFASGAEDAAISEGLQGVRQEALQAGMDADELNRVEDLLKAVRTFHGIGTE